MGKWLTENWFNLLSAVGVIGGLFITTISLRSETKTRKISNLLILTSNHREVWKEVLIHPHLTRVLDASADVMREPVTPEEWEFVNLVVLHTSSMYEALKDELVTKQKGLRRDVAVFFSLPIPKRCLGKDQDISKRGLCGVNRTMQTKDTLLTSNVSGAYLTMFASRSSWAAAVESF